MRVAVPGGVLNTANQAAAGTHVGGEQAEASVGLVVLDPCFPVLDLFAVACRVVGQAGGVSAGQLELRRLAAAALSAVHA